MMDCPKYTFLLPAYKSKFLKQALESIQRQTYENFKVIISDDCSPEDLYSICKPFLADQRFSYRRNQKNFGSENLVQHWNMLVDLCDTDYLIVASDDDVYYENFLKQIDLLTIKFPHVNLLRGRAQRINEEGVSLFKGHCADEWMDRSHYAFFLRHDFSCLQNYCYKTVALKNAGGFINFPLAWFSDDATNILLAEKGCASTNEVVFGFRSSNINISTIVSESSAVKKIDALILYHLWFCQNFCCFFLNEHQEEIHLIETIQYLHLLYLKNMARDLLYELGVYQFFKNLRKVCSYNLLGKSNMTYLYIRYRVTGHKG